METQILNKGRPAWNGDVVFNLADLNRARAAAGLVPLTVPAGYELDGARLRVTESEVLIEGDQP